VAGRRGFLGAGIAVTAVTALLLSGCGDDEAAVDPCGDSAGVTPSPGIPRPPGGLAVSERSATSVTLSWVACADLPRHYEIERRTDREPWTLHDRSDTTSYRDTLVKPDEVYYYRVCAVNDANRSEFTNEVMVSIPGATKPPEPPNLRAEAFRNGTVLLSWDESPGAVSYELERCEGVNCTEFTQIRSTTEHAYSDGDVSAATIYRYRVRAVNRIGASGYSDIAAAQAGVEGGGGGGCTCNQICVCIPVMRGLAPTGR
jgi:titin